MLAVMTATGAAYATPAEIAALKAQSAALKKQNAALEARLNRLEKQRLAQARQPQPAGQAQGAPAATSFMAADLSSIKGPLGCALPSLDGPLTFCGITLFGTVDAGLGWVSHGLPENGQNYEGQSLINKFTNHAHFGIAQNNLSQTTLGVKGETEILPGVSGVFMASTGINPQSGQLANMPGTLVSNQGLNRANYSFSGDGGRGGQAFNDQLFVGLSSKEFGQLTFGRHRCFSTDMIGAYDPAGGAYAFSPIGFNGQLLAGLGATEDARWDNSLKYRRDLWPGSRRRHVQVRGWLGRLQLPRRPDGAGRHGAAVLRAEQRRRAVQSGRRLWRPQRRRRRWLSTTRRRSWPAATPH